MINGRNSKWYRRQCDLYATRLGEWLNEHPGRKTKARTIIMQCEIELGRNLRNEDKAYEAIRAVDEIAFSAPEAAARVIHKATRPSEKFNEFWNKADKRRAENG